MSLHHADTRPLTLLMLDIDRFKDINDSFGHARGDRIIATVAEVCKHVLPCDAQLFRIGGEEFVAVMACDDHQYVLSLAEGVRHEFAVETSRAGDNRISATLSIGGIIRCYSTLPWPELLKQADTALYAAKCAGRDRVIITPAESF